VSGCLRSNSIEQNRYGEIMRNRCISITLSLAIVLSTFQGAAFAHGKDPRGGHIDAQMKKLHAMMPMFSMASAELESALDKGDVEAAMKQVDKILEVVPELKKSKPHKNIKQQKTFVELAVSLGKAVTFTADLAKKGDLAGAKTAFKKVEEVCASCHAKFRD
jgi:cytochrome c556